MTNRLPSASLFRLWAVVLLAVIGMQAILPVSQPLTLWNGSAFSAATYDTSLAAQRRDETSEAIAPLPLDPWLRTESWQALAVLPARSPAQPVASVPGPLDHNLHFWRHAPRAPPLA